MKSREELLQSPEYWFEEAQNELYRQVVDYKEKMGINQTQLAEKLGVSKGYVSQVLKGEFNYTLKKLIELSLAVGKIPQIEYKPIEQVLLEDNNTQYLKAETFDSTKPSMTIQKTSVEAPIQTSKDSVFILFAEAV